VPIAHFLKQFPTQIAKAPQTKDEINAFSKIVILLNTKKLTKLIQII